MKQLPKIVGVIQTYNEWPLLALSITHALMHHVDEVFVLNHASDDETEEKLQNLLSSWSNRIHILSSYDLNFHQEAASSTLVELCQNSSPDWFYFFDADEFLLTNENKPLREILGDIDPKYTVVNYEVENWIAPTDFDETKLDNYKNLRFRSIPNMSINADEKKIRDEIEKGNWSFYDIPFPSKVIFKNTPDAWLAAGSHYMKNLDRSLYYNANEIHAAHFPFLSKDRLSLRVIKGQRLVEGGFPAGHGWQSQLMYKFFQQGLLDKFWQSHSISNDTALDGDKTTQLSFVKDDSFATSIEPVLVFLSQFKTEDLFKKTKSQALPKSILNDTQIALGTAIKIARKFQLIADKYVIENHILTKQLSDILNSRSWRYAKLLSRILSKLRNIRRSITNRFSQGITQTSRFSGNSQQ